MRCFFPQNKCESLPFSLLFVYAHIALRELGFSDEQIYTTLEMKMKCGVGVCGRCNTDHRYICKDGPVFRMDEIGGLE